METLTAEVNVLMVGSRQVTLSVFGQLDRVDWWQMEPLGRVRPKEQEYSEVHLVGRDKDTGALVRCRVADPLNDYSTPSTWPKSLDRDEKRAVYAYFKSLKLIVLAGLR